MLWYSNPAARAWRCSAAPVDVLAFHQGLADYRPTPLTEVPALAAELGVGRVLVKDESQRLGLPAFKALGAWWAIHRTLQDRPDVTELVTATDGNHGRAVARMASMLGLQSHVFIPNVVSAPAIEAIRSEGATVTIIEDSYDAAVVAAAEAATGSAVLIQDSAWPGYEVVPQHIVDGYSTLFREIDLQPDLVVVPMGVGSVAQAAVTHYRSESPAPAVLGVEPARAACITSSLLVGKPVTVETSTTVAVRPELRYAVQPRLARTASRTGRIRHRGGVPGTPSGGRPRRRGDLLRPEWSRHPGRLHGPRETSCR